MSDKKELLVKTDVITCIDEVWTPHNWGLKERLNNLPTTTIDGNTSDGYHTFNELYHHRAMLFKTICETYYQYAWKSMQHDDPESNPMYDGMFIVGIETPEGQATYHYDVDPYWDLFNVREIARAPEWDGHTPEEALERIQSLTKYKTSIY